MSSQYTNVSDSSARIKIVEHLIMARLQQLQYLLKFHKMQPPPPHSSFASSRCRNSAMTQVGPPAENDNSGNPASSKKEKEHAMLWMGNVVLTYADLYRYFNYRSPREELLHGNTNNNQSMRDFIRSTLEVTGAGVGKGAGAGNDSLEPDDKGVETKALMTPKNGSLAAEGAVVQQKTNNNSSRSSHPNHRSKQDSDCEPDPTISFHDADSSPTIKPSVGGGSLSVGSGSTPITLIDHDSTIPTRAKTGEAEVEADTEAEATHHHHHHHHQAQAECRQQGEQYSSVVDKLNDAGCWRNDDTRVDSSSSNPNVAVTDNKPSLSFLYRNSSEFNPSTVALAVPQGGGGGHLLGTSTHHNSSNNTSGAGGVGGSDHPQHLSSHDGAASILPFPASPASFTSPASSSTPAGKRHLSHNKHQQWDTAHRCDEKFMRKKATEMYALGCGLSHLNGLNAASGGIASSVQYAFATYELLLEIEHSFADNSVSRAIASRALLSERKSRGILAHRAAAAGFSVPASGAGNAGSSSSSSHGVAASEQHHLGLADGAAEFSSSSSSASPAGHFPGGSNIAPSSPAAGGGSGSRGPKEDPWVKTSTESVNPDGPLYVYHNPNQHTSRSFFTPSYLRVASSVLHTLTLSYRKLLGDGPDLGLNNEAYECFIKFHEHVGKEIVTPMIKELGKCAAVKLAQESTSFIDDVFTATMMIDAVQRTALTPAAAVINAAHGQQALIQQRSSHKSSMATSPPTSSSSSQSTVAGTGLQLSPGSATITTPSSSSGAHHNGDLSGKGSHSGGGDDYMGIGNTPPAGSNKTSSSSSSSTKSVLKGTKKYLKSFFS